MYLNYFGIVSVYMPHIIWTYLAPGYKTFFMLNSTEHENFFLLINVKMPAIAGILTFMSGKIEF